MRIMEEENMLADFFGINGVEEAQVLGFCPKRSLYSQWIRISDQMKGYD